jgi:hypothetical protein
MTLRLTDYTKDWHPPDRADDSEWDQRVRNLAARNSPIDLDGWLAGGGLTTPPERAVRHEYGTLVLLYSEARNLWVERLSSSRPSTAAHMEWVGAEYLTAIIHLFHNPTTEGEQ